MRGTASPGWVGLLLNKSFSVIKVTQLIDSLTRPMKWGAIFFFFFVQGIWCGYHGNRLLLKLHYVKYVCVTLKVSLVKDYLGQDVVVPYAVITFMNNYITILGCLFRKLWKPGRLFQLVDYPSNRRCETDVREKTRQFWVKNTDFHARGLICTYTTYQRN